MITNMVYGTYYSSLYGYDHNWVIAQIYHSIITSDYTLIWVVIDGFKDNINAEKIYCYQ